MKIKRLTQDPGQSFFLFGPRGTGKSTWVAETFPDALFVDMVRPENARSYAAHPERLRDLVLGAPDRHVVVLDEVQKVPGVLDVVHELMEQDRGRQFVLTGSSARKLKRTGVDLLGGRALVLTMHPFMAAELGPAFDLERALNFGLLPVVFGSARPRATLAAYVGLYVREEVQQEGLVRNVGDFARFLEAVTFSHGSVLNVNAVARECQVGRKAVESYVQILEDLLLAFRLEVFTKRAQRAVSHHPKLYLADAGVFRALRPAGPLDSRDEVDGAALEGLVAQHLRAWRAYGEAEYALHFWRTSSGSEVDFVVYGEGGFWALEVKNTERVRPEDLRALQAFGEDYPAATRLLLYRGRERLLRNGIWWLPVADFLRGLTPGQPLFEA